MKYLLLILILSPLSHANTKPLAFIYSGQGICKGCDTSLAKAFREAGFKTSGIKPGEINELNLKSASVFAVPGGDQEIDVMNALESGEAKNIKNFVESGGHYVGVCLGAFLAASKIINIPDRTTTLPAGLDLFQGHVFNHSITKEARIEPIFWNSPTKGKITRMMYFQDGPHFTVSDNHAKIWATYHDGNIAAFQAKLGEGKVGLLGPHLEADESWWEEDPLHPLDDPDGKDIDLFIEYIQELLK